jgi:hypothetical protein
MVGEYSRPEVQPRQTEAPDEAENVPALHGSQSLFSDVI